MMNTRSENITHIKDNFIHTKLYENSFVRRETPADEAVLIIVQFSPFMFLWLLILNTNKIQKKSAPKSHIFKIVGLVFSEF